MQSLYRSLRIVIRSHEKGPRERRGPEARRKETVAMDRHHARRGFTLPRIGTSGALS